MFVFSNLAMSLDGKIGTSKRGLFLLGSSEDHRNMIVLRKTCDSILVGATTLRSYRKPALIPKSRRQPAQIILSTALEGISPSWEFFKSPDLQRILFVKKNPHPKKLQEFTRTSEVIVLEDSKKKSTASQVINHLKKKGFKRLLVEGGGGIMWDFAKENCIDEYHVTVTPKILGGTDSPTLVDGKGFLPGKALHLSLIQCRIVLNELYLTYRKR